MRQRKKRQRTSKYILDQNVLSDILKENNAEVLIQHKKHAHECCTTAIAIAEAFRGVHAPPEGKSPPARAEQFYKYITKEMQVFPFDVQAAKLFGKCCACFPKGKTVGWADTAIAAIALSKGRNKVLVTNNTKHFECFEQIGLTIEDWRKGNG